MGIYSIIYSSCIVGLILLGWLFIRSRNKRIEALIEQNTWLRDALVAEKNRNLKLEEYLKSQGMEVNDVY